MGNIQYDFSDLIFTRSSASRVLGLGSSSMTTKTPPADDLNKTFTLFPCLPTELRLIIWEFAMREPRLIVVSYTSTTGQDDRPVFVDAPPPPSYLSTCRESREVALKTYQQCHITTQCPSPTYLNFDQDSFLLGGPDSDLDIDYLMSILLPENSHKVRFLHVSRGCWKQLAYWTHLQSRYSGLEELTISFPTGTALRPYRHDCWYGTLSRENKEAVVKSELYEREGDEADCWKPEFRLKIVHYDSPPSSRDYSR